MSFRCSIGFSFRNAILEPNQNWSKMENAKGATWREKFVLINLEKEVVSSFVKRMIQRIFVGHHDRTRAIFIHYQDGNCARQNLDKTDSE